MDGDEQPSSQGPGPDPAQRFAAARQRAVAERSALGRFQRRYDFTLDPFQVEACQAVEAGEGVLVAAPTGAGKTVVGEFAAQLAVDSGRKCFYTTPIKALSNQKYADLVARHGAADVGLLTGDNTINGDAPVVVMTTEVLRNMLYTGSSTLHGLGFVVMDEVHYLADRFRGAVWEEVIIHLTESVQLVSLSATVSNAEEFGAWLATVRGTTRIVVEERRPVPLWQHVMVGSRLLDLFTTGPETGEHAEDVELRNQRPRVNPRLVEITREAHRSRDDASRRRRDGRYPGRQRAGIFTPRRVEVIERLDAEGLLPAITFVFSRAGCDAAVEQCQRSRLRLTTPAERTEIRAFVTERCAPIPDEDLAVLGYGQWLDALERGLAAHHAGLLPTFKEVVEELFVRGLVRAVFATETLALGINMPARSVVLERLVKWNGEAHADVTPGEYTQLTGRAGRRGIDVEGHAVVLWQPDLDVAAVAGLASTRTYPLRSSFRPSYNMAVNLIRQFGVERSRELLEQSFAQFQTDQAVVGIVRQIRRNDEALAGYAEAMGCHLGDFTAYVALGRQLSELERAAARSSGTARRSAAIASLDALRPGDVIDVPAGRRAGIAVVLDPGMSGGDGPRPLVLTVGRQVRRLSLVDFPTPVAKLGTIRVPKGFDARSPQSRRDLASALRAKDFGGPVRVQRNGDAGRPATGGDDATLVRLRQAIRAHPCHGCTDRDDHARWAERHARLERDTRTLRQRSSGQTQTIARQFDRLRAVLRTLGYLADADMVTPAGVVLGRIYSELDLVVAESLRRGVWAGLDEAELAACVSAVAYESRHSDEIGPPRLPPGPVPDVLASMERIWTELDALQRDHGLDDLRPPDPGFAWEAYLWASGRPLAQVLTAGDRTPGDFVRWARQLVDLLGQVATATTDRDIGAVARRAADAVRRGVVAYSSVG